MNQFETECVFAFKTLTCKILRKKRIPKNGQKAFVHLVKLLQRDDWAPLLRGAGAVQVVGVSLAANRGALWGRMVNTENYCTDIFGYAVF